VHAAPYNASLESSDDTNEQSQRSPGARGGHNVVTSPNLRDYESSKFELAEILRAIKSKCSKERVELHTRITELFTRLAEDRFNLAVVGRFSRGKSTLMNAILGVDRLPMGILPLTSVITSVTYASREDIRIEFEHGRMDYEIRMSELADYVTERGNPRNIKRVARARIGLPVELLRRGFYFVDTPGLGSNIVENARTTEGFLPEADAFLMVSGYDAPLSDDEIRVARTLARLGRRVFFVLNKQDVVSEAERREVYRYVQDRLIEIFGGTAPQLFSVSARVALQGKLAADAARLESSGVTALEEELTRFLIEDKSREFLGAMCKRTLQVLAEIKPDVDADGLRARLVGLRHQYTEQGPVRTAVTAESTTAQNIEARVEECPLCRRVNDALFEFLCQFQYELVTSAEVRERFASAGGLCESHLCLYASVASERGLCLALAPLMRRMSTTLRDAAAQLAHESPFAVRDRLNSANTGCAACQIQSTTELEAIEQFALSRGRTASAASGKLPFLCVPHLRVTIAHVQDLAWLGVLLRGEASAAERLAEDMQRYVLKRDGIRHGLATEEESRAAKDAIEFIAGRR
jgi:GTP-binding protein EngB required for normal cell division